MIRNIAVLFVDDEPCVLDGISNALFGKFDRWQVHFTRSGAGALDVLTRERIDVLVSDMRMPGMPGEELLEQVRLAHPTVARVALSGDPERFVSERARQLLHEVLRKPCDGGALAAAVTAALATAMSSDMERLHRFMARLPAAIGGRRRHPGDPAVASELFELYGSPAVLEDLDVEHHGDELVTVLDAAGGCTALEALTARVHDVGRIAIKTWGGPKLAAIEVHDGGRAVSPAVERAVLGFDHAALGARLVQAAGLDPRMARAVAFHHRPWALSPHDPAWALAVRVAAADAAVRGALIPADAPGWFVTMTADHVRATGHSRRSVDGPKRR